MQAIIERLFGVAPVLRSESHLERLRQLEEQIAWPGLHEDFAELFSDSDVIVLVGEQADDRFVWVSKSVERILGYTPEDFCSRSFWSYIHPDDIASTQARYMGMHAAVTKPSRFSNRYRHRDGHYVRLRWATSRWRDDRCLCLAFPCEQSDG